jgi:2-polyprenyl-3-methyl-5-hydroxy-6-metoxy-1,4-benzoquinol methylase
VAREMMFGTREQFDYFVCASCGCTQIDAIPHDLERHYPPEYRSWTPAPEWRRTGLLEHARGILVHGVADYQLGHRGIITRLLNRLALNRARLPAWLDTPEIASFGLTRRSAILDVGTGSGANLQALASVGFSNLHGIDPFIDGGVGQKCGSIQFRRTTITDLAGSEVSSAGGETVRKFDLVMFHHSLEHVADPVGTMTAARQLLTRRGRVLVRIPLADSAAAEEYGVDWVQFDAPRHVCLFSVASMQKLAQRSGLEIENIVYDSMAFQFWGSELYRRDIPLEDPRSVVHDPPFGPFSESQMNEWTHRAEYLNAIGRGDSAVFYLRSEA